MLSRQALLRSVRAAAPQRVAGIQTRSYAAAAAIENVKAPVAVFGLDGTYATALVCPPTHPIDLQHYPFSCLELPIELQTTLNRQSSPQTRIFHPADRLPCVIYLVQYTAAVKTSTLDPTAKGIASLASLIEKDPKLVQILAAPTLSGADKSAVVAELVKAANIQGETVKNFLDTLAVNNRLSLIPGVVTKFAELISAARGEVEMTVTSAQVRI